MAYIVERIDSSDVLDIWTAKGINPDSIQGYTRFNGFWSDITGSDSSLFNYTIRLFGMLYQATEACANSASSEADYVTKVLEKIQAGFNWFAVDSAKGPLTNKELLRLYTDARELGGPSSSSFRSTLISDPINNVSDELLFWTEKLFAVKLQRLTVTLFNCRNMLLFFPSENCSVEAALAVLAYQAGIDFLLVDGELVADWKRQVLEYSFNNSQLDAHLLNHVVKDREYKALISKVLGLPQLTGRDIEIPFQWRDLRTMKKYDSAMSWKH